MTAREQALLSQVDEQRALVVAQRGAISELREMLRITVLRLERLDNLALSISHATADCQLYEVRAARELLTKTFDLSLEVQS